MELVKGKEIGSGGVQRTPSRVAKIDPNLHSLLNSVHKSRKTKGAQIPAPEPVVPFGLTHASVSPSIQPTDEPCNPWEMGETAPFISRWSFEGQIGYTHL